MMPLALLACLPALMLQIASPVGIRAEYGWGYAGADGSGKGTLAVLVDPATGRVVLELHGMGERLVFLQGDRTSGYHVLVPRRDIDQRAATLAGLPLPFLPQVGSAEALLAALTEGQAPGLKVTRRDAQGPKKLRFDGKSDQGKEFTVWLERIRLEPLPKS